MNRIDEIRLDIYESYEDGDISEYEKDLLLEKCNIVEESTALQRHMKDRNSGGYAYGSDGSDKFTKKDFKKYHIDNDDEKLGISFYGIDIRSCYREIKRLERSRKDIKNNPNLSLAKKDKLCRDINHKISDLKDEMNRYQYTIANEAIDFSLSSKNRGDDLAKEIAKEKKIREQQKKL